jgi:hypothetical protein
MDWIQQYSGALTFFATLALIALTGFYVYWTRGILNATANQSRLALNPVIGISSKSITISSTFGPQRRNMSVELELTNVGNAPAIELLVDAEVILGYSEIDGHTTVPARYEPDMIPFLQSGQSTKLASPNFGNVLVLHFFDDVREQGRLNLHRIRTRPTEEAYRASRLRIVAYYRNSLGQHFKGSYEVDITIWKMNGEEPIPADTEAAEVTMTYVPRPVFHAEPIDASLSGTEISRRNAIRSICGW